MTMAEEEKPKRYISRRITEEDVERLRKQAPDYIVDASDDIMDMWIAAEWAKEVRDLSPVRYGEVQVQVGTEQEHTLTIDFQTTVNVTAYIKTQGGDMSAVRRANALRMQYLRLDREYQNAVLTLNRAMGINSRKPRNIVDYTAPILEMFGKFYTVTDVAKVMAKEYRIKVPEDELKKFYVDNRDIITKRRAEYVLHSKDFRVATETGRLEVLNQMLVDIEIKNKAAGGSNVDYCNLIIRILEQARKEVKGNDLKMTIDGRIDINATLHAETNVMEVMRTLSINSLVIGLTAAKAGLNPAVLIGQLASSWYSRMNGFNGNVLDETSVTLPSALIKTYNWEEIKENSKKFIKEFSPIAEVVDEVDPTAAEQAETHRRDILMRLRSLKESRAKETHRANPATPDSRNITELDESEGYQDLTPVDSDGPDPKHEFEVDYALNKHYPQPKGMRIKGAIGESIARHKAMKEAGEVNVRKDEAERRRRNEKKQKLRNAKAQEDERARRERVAARRKERRETRKKDSNNDKNEE